MAVKTKWYKGKMWRVWGWAEDGEENKMVGGEDDKRVAMNPMVEVKTNKVEKRKLSSSHIYDIEYVHLH